MSFFQKACNSPRMPLWPEIAAARLLTKSVIAAHLTVIRPIHSYNQAAIVRKHCHVRLKSRNHEIQRS
jgi:hypothetical protein